MGLDETPCRILQLSDCTMMYILSYLDATSLFNLSRTCSYFKNIVEDQKLWRYIDARNEPNSTKKVQYVCERVHDRTTHILLRAESKYDGNVPQDFLAAWTSLENLTVLALENQKIDGKLLTLADFPKSLEELSFKKSVVKNGKSFFQNSFTRMRNLRVLILDECDWLDSNFFMSVAKYENLEILSLIKCQKLHLNIIPYLSVAKHGCKKLKVIDCRFNTIGNDVIRTLDSHKSLLALYFQSMRSYELDTGKPIFNCKIRHLSKDDKELLFQNTIKNQSLDTYLYAVGDMLEELPQSELYQDPYPDCTCGYRDKTDPEKNPTPKEKINKDITDLSLTVDDYINFQIAPQKFICRRHNDELKKLPKDFKNFFYQNQKKFYPDSSDDDSDSDDDSNCCMFGVGKSQKMIVLKMDGRGNIPEPEVIDISHANVWNPITIDVNLFGSQERQQQRPSNANVEPQPGPSRQSNDRVVTLKRKAEDNNEEHPSKRARLQGELSSSNFLQEAGPSSSGRPDTSDNTRNKSGNNSNTSDDDELEISESTEKNNEPQPGPSPSQNRDNRANNEANRRAIQGAQRRFGAPFEVMDFDIVLPRNYRILARLQEEGIRNQHIALLNDFMGPKPDKKLKLRRLSLRGYREVSNLDCIRNLNLDLLDVTYTNVSKRTVEEFLMINPNCRVLHEDYCICKPRIPK